MNVSNTGHTHHLCKYAQEGVCYARTILQIVLEEHSLRTYGKQSPTTTLYETFE